MFRFSILGGSLLLIVAACGSSDTGPDSTAASTTDGGASVVATTVTQAPATTLGDQPGTTTTQPAAPAGSTTTQPVAAGPSEILTAIQDRGVVNIATSVGNFVNFVDFEVALAAAVADVLVPGIEVAYRDVTARDRFMALAVGDIDMGVRMTTHTVSREGEAAFSQPYLLGGTVALVSPDSGIASIEDLDGRTIAVLDGTPALGILEDALTKAGVSATLDLYQARGQIGAALSSGAVDAGVFSWVSATDNVLRLGQPFSIVPIDILREPIAIFTAASDPAFAAEVRTALQTVIDDGTWLSLFEKSFGAPPPWSVEEMLAVQPADR